MIYTSSSSSSITVLDFIKKLEKYKTATEAIENIFKTEKIEYKEQECNHIT
tara:strand:+ start:133 stop:285 length:153 start_codon:yes stop_codon:yes gene_type:complete